MNFKQREHELIETYECICGFKTEYHDLLVEHLLKDKSYSNGNKSEVEK